MTLQLIAVTLLKLNNSVRTLERIESLPCESATDFFYVFTPPFSANIPSFCNTNYLLLFLKPQTKTGYEKDKSKRNTSKLEVGKLFPWIIYCYHWSIYHSCRTDFISNSSQEKQIKESMQMIKMELEENLKSINQAEVAYLNEISFFRLLT